MVCFAAGTRIKTPHGDVRVEDLRVGDLVSTLEGEAKPIRWIGSRTLDRFDLLANPNMRPVLIRQGALGQGMPNHDLKVSPQHRLMLRSKVAQRVLGDAEALVPAKKLTHLPDIDVQADCTEVQYFHFVLEEHSIVIAEHAYTESLYTGSEALKMLGPDALEELAFLFPELTVTQPTPARPLHSRGKLIEKMCLRLVQNQKPAVEPAR
ncbi:Hint domain-containing protein [Ruegeria sp. R8_2]|nr:Hint domain-containing protein [Ruegeria sp. R8_1]MBO9414679.1 Hint domain-containing protein [Ruegeria sp. R8_2]